VGSHRNTLMTMDVCHARNLLKEYIASLTVGLQHTVAEHISADDPIVKNLSASTLFVGGAVLLLAPVLFGNRWLRIMVSFVGALCGAIGAETLIASPLGRTTLAAIPAPSEALCGVDFVLVIGCTVLSALTAARSVDVGYFAVGATSAAYAAWVLSGLLHLQSETYSLLLIAALAIVGGIAFVQVADALIDAVLGGLGATLVAQGTLNFAIANHEAIGTIPGASNHYFLYVLCLSAGLLLMRRALTRPHVQLHGGREPLIHDRDPLISK